MQIQAVLFDMDGLMIDTERLSDQIWCEIGARYGLTITPADTALLRGRNRAGGRAAFLKRFGPDVPFDTMCDAVVGRLTALLARSVTLMPGLTELLEALRSRNIPMAVVSSTHRSLVENNLRVAGIRDFFSELVCGDMVRRSKPAPDIYLTAARQLNIPPQACLVLEDSYNGVRAGAAAGCITVMVPNMDPATPEMEQLCRCIVPSLREVIPLLDQDL